MGRRHSGVAARWRERITRWRRSGLSIAEFCRREQVSQPSFYGWRRRLRDAWSNSRRPVFVPVEIGAAEPSPGGVRIELPGGAVVRLPAETSVAVVSAAIRAAMSTTAASDAEEASC